MSELIPRAKKNLPVKVTLGGPNRSKRAEFAIFFPSPVDTGKIIEFFYTYSTPHTYEEGKDYFEWYFGQPHNHYQVEMKFDRVWDINDPVVFCGEDLDWFNVQQLSSQHLKWMRYFPKLHATYRIEFVLTRTK